MSIDLIIQQLHDNSSTELIKQSVSELVTNLYEDKSQIDITPILKQSSSYVQLLESLQKLNKDFIYPKYFEILQQMKQSTQDQVVIRMPTEYIEKQKQILENYKQIPLNNLKMIALEQTKLKMQQIKDVYLNINEAFQLLQKRNLSQNQLEQTFFQQEFIKITQSMNLDIFKELQNPKKQEKNKKAANKVQKQSILAEDFKYNLISGKNFDSYRRMFVQCYSKKECNQIMFNTILEELNETVQQLNSYTKLNKYDITSISLKYIKLMVYLIYYIDEPIVPIHSPSAHQRLLDKKEDSGTLDSIAPINNQLDTFDSEDLDTNPIIIGIIGSIDTLNYINLSMIGAVNKLMSQSLPDFPAAARILMMCIKTQLTFEHLVDIAERNQTETDRFANKNYQYKLQKTQILLNEIISTTVNGYSQDLWQSFKNIDAWMSYSVSEPVFVMRIAKPNEQVDIPHVFQMIKQLDQSDQQNLNNLLGFLHSFVYNEKIDLSVQSAEYHEQFIEMQTLEDKIRGPPVMHASLKQIAFLCSFSLALGYNISFSFFTDLITDLINETQVEQNEGFIKDNEAFVKTIKLTSSLFDFVLWANKLIAKMELEPIKINWEGIYQLITKKHFKMDHVVRKSSKMPHLITRGIHDVLCVIQPYQISTQLMLCIVKQIYQQLITFYTAQEVNKTNIQEIEDESYCVAQILFAYDETLLPQIEFFISLYSDYKNWPTAQKLFDLNTLNIVAKQFIGDKIDKAKIQKLIKNE
ncbi:Hypothetical_protein [Hexamita inflata]|uniref:Hypothetical_protein n=1 Tax=Hexamita inflata TaxID=28002 RepID=A0AA86NTI0_9EUKA|nr:Hypothetical protein HINF_LOCUS12161 [Hexamita inflata]